jgi:RNA polymerase sigma-70 factor (ECF subfamily)
VAVSSSADSPVGCPETEAAPARGGELPDAFDRLYSEHFEFVWRSLRRLGVSLEYLDDAVQDVFIVSLRRQHEFMGQSSQRTWLFGIATNVTHEYRRKAQRAALNTPVPDSYRANDPSPLEQAANGEELRLIDTLLQSLDEPKRHDFILAELEQMSAPEIATALGIKLNTVYSRLRAARQAFFELLESTGGKHE